MRSDASRRFLTFLAGGRCLALPLPAVREILPRPRLRRVPGAPSLVEGVARVHRRFVPVLDTSRYTGATGGRPCGSHACIVVTRTPRQGRNVDLALAADDACDVIELDDADILAGRAERQGVDIRLLDLEQLLAAVAADRDRRVEAEPSAPEQAAGAGGHDFRTGNSHTSRG